MAGCSGFRERNCTDIAAETYYSSKKADSGITAGAQCFCEEQERREAVKRGEDDPIYDPEKMELLASSCAKHVSGELREPRASETTMHLDSKSGSRDAGK